jgi:hypothetical protein
MAYQSYLFKDKDLVIDELRTMLEDQLGGRLTRKGLKLVEANGGPSVATLDAWFFGEVKKPQNPGVEATGRALGYYRKWAKLEKEAHDLIKAKAARENAKKKVEAARKRAKANRKKR